MSVRWITDAGELDALGPAWAALCDRAPASSPFERPEWLLPWAAVFADGGRLRVLTIHQAGALSAVVPLMEADRSGRLGSLCFMGTGVSDYHDAVLADGSPELTAEMWRALARRDWATCAIERLRPGSPLLGRIPEAAAGIGGEAVDQEVCPALTVGPGARTLAEAVPTGYARRLARARRQAERHGTMFHVPARLAEAEALLEGLCGLHAARWQLRGEPGVLADPSVQRFHRRVVRAMWSAGHLRLFGLDLGGSLAAVVYGFSVHGRMSFYLGAFDPRRAPLSPGALLIAFAIERLLAEGVTVFDFLRGRESYKYRFGAADQPCFGRTLRRLGAAEG